MLEWKSQIIRHFSEHLVDDVDGNKLGTKSTIRCKKP